MPSRPPPSTIKGIISARPRPPAPARPSRPGMPVILSDLISVGYRDTYYNMRQRQSNGQLPSSPLDTQALLAWNETLNRLLPSFPPSSLTSNDKAITRITIDRTPKMLLNLGRSPARKAATSPSCVLPLYANASQPQPARRTYSHRRRRCRVSNF